MTRANTLQASRAALALWESWQAAGLVYLDMSAARAVVARRARAGARGTSKNLKKPEKT